MLRELAELWLTNNCRPQSDIPHFLRHIDQADERDLNCWFRFGSGTIKSGGSWLVYCFEEELFAFALDQRQSSRFNLKANQITFGNAGKRLCVNTRKRPPGTLKPPEITVATTDRIVGRLAYEMPYHHMRPYRLRMTWDGPDGRAVNNYHYPVGPLMPTGVIPFEFRLNSADAPPLPSGLVLAFFALNCEWEQGSFSNPLAKMSALSDTQAVLLDLHDVKRNHEP